MSTTPEDSALDAACRIARASGYEPLRCEPLSRGSSSIAVRVTSADDDLVVRIADPNPGKRACYESDFAIREGLHRISPSGAGPFTAEPVATSRDLDIAGIDCEWAIDGYLDGSHPVRGQISQALCRQLGGALADLHRVPVCGHGRLENTRDALRGIRDEPAAGLCTRFESPWPFSDSPLSDHPAVRTEPGLGPGLAVMEVGLHAFGTDARESVIVHADLHEGQILVSGDRLVALLDFGDAMAGSRDWDLGSFWYFHGKACFDTLLEGYCPTLSDRPARRRAARFASILIALHHGNRAARLDRPARLKTSIAHLSTMLCR